MTLNNNLSILPFYKVTTENPTPMECEKWWNYGRVWPLINNTIPPFQIAGTVGRCSVRPYEPNTQGGLSFQPSRTKYVDSQLYTWYPYGGVLTNRGRFYIETTIDGVPAVSDVFTIVGSLLPYLKLEWWDDNDFIMDDGAIIYTSSLGVNDYKNILYLPVDLAKPSYEFEEEGENRDGYFFPIKQISYKRFRFSILAPEYICDIMRFIRLSDHIRITYRGQVYNADTFLITPNWEGEGDLARVECEFTTNTVAKKIGRLITP